jgi:hypothetical protein
MVIAALLSFAILFVAWVLAPGGPSIVRRSNVEIEALEADPLAAAA